MLGKVSAQYFLGVVVRQGELLLSVCSMSAYDLWKLTSERGR